jgi:hypothetical protein
MFATIYNFIALWIYMKQQGTRIAGRILVEREDDELRMASATSVYRLPI